VTLAYREELRYGKKRKEAGVKKNVSPNLGKTSLEREIQMTAKRLPDVLLSFRVIFTKTKLHDL
jgi:hypothetical protein